MAFYDDFKAREREEKGTTNSAPWMIQNGFVLVNYEFVKNLQSIPHFFLIWSGDVRLFCRSQWDVSNF